MSASTLITPSGLVGNVGGLLFGAVLSNDCL